MMLGKDGICGIIDYRVAGESIEAIIEDWLIFINLGPPVFLTHFNSECVNYASYLSKLNFSLFRFFNDYSDSFYNITTSPSLSLSISRYWFWNPRRFANFWMMRCILDIVVVIFLLRVLNSCIGSLRRVQWLKKCIYI